MQWNIERSKERLRQERARIEKAGLNISRLTREMDLANLSPTDARIVHGTHLYCHISNLGEVLDSPLMRQDNFKRLHRLLHVLRVEQRYTLQQVFGGDKIQVQGPKFHGLIHRPYDDDPSLAWKAVLAALALNLIVRDAMAIVFPQYLVLQPATGIDIGDCLVANIGAKGDRELISVGSAANYAAKILEGNNAITVGPKLWSNLSEDRKELFFQVGNSYVLDESAIEDPEEIIRQHSYEWSIRDAADRMEKTVNNLPLNEIDSSEARVRIDFSLLGPKTMKMCSGASVFVDVDKYSATIDALLEDEAQLGNALRWLHLFRYEMQHLTVDRDAAAIQHQGDRLQALSHLPYDDDGEAMRAAIELCIDCNSSVEEVLNVDHPILGPLHVSIGASFGTAVAVRSGVRGDLDSSCLSKTISEAEHWQMRGIGGEIAISSKMYDALEDEVVRGQFTFDKAKSCYVAKNLTWTKIADIRHSNQYASKAPVAFNKQSSGIVFGMSARHSEDNIPLKQTRNWGIDE
jgi:class 3 adenylate cyclase